MSELGRPVESMIWEEPEGYPGHLWILGRECMIWLEPRPHYCDRGRYIAKVVSIWGGLALPGAMDWADGWPRYYFDLERAKAEIIAWLECRGQR
jgi:hypothetical protein